MLLGGINPDQYIHPLHNFSIATDSWWAPSLNGIHYGEHVMNLFSDHQAYAVIDTGTSMLCMPKGYFTLMAAQWKSNLPQSHPLDCSLGVCIAKEHCD